MRSTFNLKLTGLNLFIAALLILMTSCESKQVHKSFDKATKYPEIEIWPDLISVSGDTIGFEYSFKMLNEDDGVKIIQFELFSSDKKSPEEIRLEWRIPKTAISQFWTSNISVDKHNFWNSSVTSRASSQVPLISLISNDDQNRFTFALSDAMNKIRSGFYIKEEDAHLNCYLVLFSEPLPAFDHYSLDIRIDTRPIYYSEAIAGCSDWWAGMANYAPAKVPEDARQPMYSTWYSFHQNLDVDKVISECRIGKSMGLEAVIVDDGWQTLDSQRGYAYTGDWKPERIGDMAAFVDSIHALDMKFLLWYSLPFIGEKSSLYDHFKGRYLHHWESQGTWVLDPRYPEVREHIINTYETALTEWDLDGFKLDFLGWFYADDKTDLTAKDGRDYASVNEAADRLMTDIMSRLKAIEPDILIEFRQPYIGPLMRKYGNMFRAADCPDMAAINRVRTTDLRLASGNTAVHSDMFMWHPDEPIESAALQILNILFSVPQLSVMLNTIPEEQREMAAFWMRYWKENKELLLDGKFRPKNPGSLYPEIRSTLEKQVVIALYNDMVAILESSQLDRIDLINAKVSTSIIIDNKDSGGTFDVKVYDCSGVEVDSYILKLTKGIQEINVPASGFIRLTRSL